MKSGLNLILKWVLYLAIIRHAINIPQQLIKISSGVYDDSICYVTIGINVVMMVILWNVIRVKKNALNMFFVFQYINALLVGMMEQRGDYATPLFISTILCGIMAALLFLKKNGVSGWELFYPSAQRKNCFWKNKDSAEAVKDVVSEPEVSVPAESNVLEKLCTEVQLNSLDIPKKEDGTIDYEAMTVQQQFEYTCATESIAVACKDLKREISRMKKDIKRMEKGLSVCSGGKLAELRDMIRMRKAEVADIESLIPLSYKEKSANNKKLIMIGVSVIVVWALLFSCLLWYEHRGGQDEQVVMENIKSDNPVKDESERSESITDRKITNLYNALVDEGYKMESEPEFRKNLSSKEYRRRVYDALVRDGYDMEPFDEFEDNIGFGRNNASSINE